MSVAICTPTRGRYEDLIRQGFALSPQLQDGDLWIVGSDNESDEEDAFSICRYVRRTFPKHGCWAGFDYHPSNGNLNRVRNALAAFAPTTHDLVLLDDHDPLEPYALSEIRQAFAAGYDYVLGWHKQRALIDYPDGTRQFEEWPTVERSYTPGDFAAGRIDAIAVHGIRRGLWDQLGGWDATFPGGDKSFAIRAEAAGAKIVCLQLPLCCVTVDPSGICGQFHPVT